MKHPLSLSAFADWCERKPADEAYIYLDGENCACAQYGRDIGLEFPFPLGGNVDHPHFEFWRLADHLACWAGGQRQTFGDLAKLLRHEAAKAEA